MTGQIGFDEGGVLEALNEEVFTRTTTLYKRNRKGEITSETTDVVKVSVATVIAALALYYGPEVFTWFQAAGVGSGELAQGLWDKLNNLTNKAVDEVLPDGTTPNPEFVGMDFETAMRHSDLSRREFKKMLTVTPAYYETFKGGFANCGLWRRANSAQKKMYKQKYDLEGQTPVYNPSCWGVG